MEIEYIEENKNKLTFEIEGEDHTFCNLLKEELQNNKDVKMASYKIKHPLVNKVTLFLETSGADPKKIIVEAAKSIQKQTSKFQSLI